jgi:lipopolysaccharide transport system ATP-binding protein
MPSQAIVARGLGKKYALRQRETSTLLRDQMTAFLRSPLRHLRRHTLETFWALKDVSFDCSTGEVVGLIGRNGAGKSTLLKVLSRITRPTEGCADLHGRLGSLLEVGTGFHSELSGRENIYLSGAILGMSKQEIDSKFDAIVEFSELSQFIDMPVKHYSSGMYVRLAFAVAAHLEPEILLVDEVLAVGDSAFQEKCLGKMNEISGTGRTIILVSHNMGAITQLCKRCLLIDKGRILEDGPTHATVSKYLASFTTDSTSVEYPREGNAGSPITTLRIWIAGEHGQAIGSVDVRKGFQVGIKVLVRRAFDGLDIGFRIDNSLKIPIFTSNMGQAMGRDDLLQPGENTFLIPVKGNFLAPDLYSLTVGLHRPNQEIYEMREHALNFRVEESGSSMWQYHGSNYGNILVDCQWNRV